MDPETPDELRSLPRQETPPAWLEERIVAELKTRGLISRTPSAHRWLAAAAGVAASILLFAAGLATGNQMNRSQATTIPGPRFILLLYEDGGYLAPGPEGAAGRVAQYRDWAGELSSRGLLVGGEKLKDDGSIRGEPGTLAGYFIIAAADPSEAFAIARDCPHLRYGGKVVVREIDPT